LKRQIVHYYFNTIEDLLIAVIRRDSDEVRERFIQTLDSNEPLRVIWELGNNVPTTIFEFAAMALAVGRVYQPPTNCRVRSSLFPIFLKTVREKFCVASSGCSTLESIRAPSHSGFY
jgi:AcrR family transcriptional regulator